eukprot:357664-Chlamydomonas_euryale.AAC.3
MRTGRRAANAPSRHVERGLPTTPPRPTSPSANNSCLMLDRKTLPRARVPDLGMSTYMRRLGLPSQAHVSRAALRACISRAPLPLRASEPSGTGCRPAVCVLGSFQPKSKGKPRQQDAKLRGPWPRWMSRRSSSAQPAVGQPSERDTGAWQARREPTCRRPLVTPEPPWRGSSGRQRVAGLSAVCNRTSALSSFVAVHAQLPTAAAHHASIAPSVIVTESFREFQGVVGGCRRSWRFSCH